MVECLLAEQINQVPGEWSLGWLARWIHCPPYTTHTPLACSLPYSYSFADQGPSVKTIIPQLHDHGFTMLPDCYHVYHVYIIYLITKPAKRIGFQVVAYQASYPAEQDYSPYVQPPSGRKNSESSEVE